MRVMHIVSKQTAALRESRRSHRHTCTELRIARLSTRFGARRAGRKQALDNAAVDRIAVTFQDPERVAASRQIGRGHPGLPVANAT